MWQPAGESNRRGCAERHHRHYNTLPAHAYSVEVASVKRTQAPVIRIIRTWRIVSSLNGSHVAECCADVGSQQCMYRQHSATVPVHSGVVH